MDVLRSAHRAPGHRDAGLYQRRTRRRPSIPADDARGPSRVTRAGASISNNDTVRSASGLPAETAPGGHERRRVSKHFDQEANQQDRLAGGVTDQVEPIRHASNEARHQSGQRVDRVERTTNAGISKRRPVAAAARVAPGVVVLNAGSLRPQLLHDMPAMYPRSAA
jgi:hypothetical protein